jgi:hypothetical protein
LRHPSVFEVIPARDQYDGVVAQRTGHMIGPASPRMLNADVDTVIGQTWRNFVVADVGSDEREALQKLRDHRSQAVPAERGRYRSLDQTLGMRRTEAHIRDGFVQLAQQERHALEELPPFARQTQLTRGPIEEPHTKFTLQSGNALTYVGWCDLEPVCRRDEAAATHTRVVA